MDDKPIPRSEYGTVVIEDFQISLERDYLTGRLVNNSALTISSARFQFNLYQPTSKSNSLAINPDAHNAFLTGANSRFTELTEVDSLPGYQFLVGDDFLIRHALKPGYSTEFYFELKMDFERGNYLYSKDIIELRGK